MAEVDVDEMRRELASISLVLKVDPSLMENLINEVVETVNSMGLRAEKRAEGYAFIPSIEAAVIGLPHLRLAHRGDLVTIWVRDPYALDGERCERVGISAMELHKLLVEGARKIASIFKHYGKEGDTLTISLP